MKEGLIFKRFTIMISLLIIISFVNIAFAQDGADLAKTSQIKVEDKINEKIYKIDDNSLIESLLSIVDQKDNDNKDNEKLIAIILIFILKDKFSTPNKEDVKNFFNHYTLKYKDKLTISIKFKKEKE